MQAIEKNIHRHEKGVLYFVARRDGRLAWRSLRTKNLEQARKLLREQGVQDLIAAQQAPVSLPQPGSKQKVPLLGVAEALDEFERGLVLLSAGAGEMATRGRRAVQSYCKGWDAFSPVKVWNAYRMWQVN